MARLNKRHWGFVQEIVYGLLGIRYYTYGNGVIYWKNTFKLINGHIYSKQSFKGTDWLKLPGMVYVDWLQFVVVRV